MIYTVIDKSTGAEIYRYSSTAPVAWSGMGFDTHDHTALPEDDEQHGVLKLDDKTRETLSDFNTRMLAVMGGARDMLAAADKATKADPVLVAHEAREGKS